VLSEDQRLLLYAVATSTSGARPLIASLQTPNEDSPLLANDLRASLPLTVRTRRPSWEQYAIQVADHQIRLTQRSRHPDPAVTITAEELAAFASSVVLPSPAPSTLDEIDALMHDLLAITAIPTAAETATHDPNETDTAPLGPTTAPLGPTTAPPSGEDMPSDEPTASPDGPIADLPGDDDDPAPVAAPITAEHSTDQSEPGTPLVALEDLAGPLLRDNLVLKMVAAAHSAGSAAAEQAADLFPQVASGDQPSIPDERLPITAQSVSAQLKRLGISVRPNTRLDWHGIRVGKYPIKNVVSVYAVHELPSKEKQMAEEAAEALGGQGYYVYRAAGAARMTVSRPASTTRPDGGAATATAGPAISPEMLHSPLTRSAAEDVYSALIASADNNALLKTLTTAGIDPLEHLYQQAVPTVLQQLAAETGDAADIADLHVIDPRTVLVGDPGAVHVRLAYAATDTGQLRRWTAQPSQYTRTFDNRSLRAAIERAREVVRNNQHSANAPGTDPAAENPLGLIAPYERNAGADGQLHIVEAGGHHYVIKRRRSGPESLSVWTARPADTDTELGWRTDRMVDSNLGSMDQAVIRLREDLAAQAERDAHAEEQQRLFDAAAATTPLFTDLHGTWLPLELLDPVEQYLGALPEADPPGRRLLLALGDRHYLVHQVLTGLQDLSTTPPPPVYGPHRYEISTAQATTDATDPTAIVAGEHLGTIDTIEVAMPWLRELHRAQVLDEAYEANLSPTRDTAADIAAVTTAVAAHWEIRQFTDTHDLSDERIQQAARVLATRLVTAHLNNILLDPDEDTHHAQTRALYDHHRGEIVDQVLATIVSDNPTTSQTDNAAFGTILGTPIPGPVPEALRERLAAEITARDNVLASEDADIPWRQQLRRQRIYTQAKIKRLNTELGLDPGEWPRSADRAALEREILGARNDFDSALNDFPEMSDNERRGHRADITALIATEHADDTDHANSEGPLTDLEIAVINCLTDDKAALFNHPAAGGDAARYVAEVALNHLPGRSHNQSYSAIKDIALARIADRGADILGLTQAQVKQRQEQRREAAQELLNDALEAVVQQQFDSALSLVDRAELTDPMGSGPGNRSYAFIRERINARRAESEGADHAPVASSTGSEPAEGSGETAGEDAAPADIDRSRDWKHPGTITVPSGKRSRARANMTAIEIVQRLNDEDRPATTLEQEQLAQWSGWGAVPEIFDARQADWDNDRERLYGLLDDSGRESALDSILSAYYTDPAIVAAMWSALGSAGFSGGRVLEPGAGTGTFAGLAPASAEMVCVENEPISAKIAHHLYPSALVRLEGFQHTKVPPDFFVATIGNVPFGKFEVRDPVHNPRGHSIHNAFLLKSLALTAPGGYVAVITSPWTMDAENDLARRDMLAVADFVGAVRLPGRAFSRVAGTGAVTDIVILRKRDPSIDPSKRDALPAAVSARNHQFRATQSRTVPDTVTGERTTLRISKWFAENPGYVLGDVSAGGGMQRSGHLNVEHHDLDRLPGDVQAALRKIIVSARVDGLALTARAEDLPENSYPRSGLVIHDPDKKFTSPIGTMRYHEGRFEAVTDYGTWEPVKVYAKRSVETRALLRLRDLAHRVVLTQRENHEPTERDEARANLNAEYDAYVRKYGYINRFKWQGGRERTEEERDKRFAELESKWRTRHSDHQGNPYLGELPPEIWEEFDEKAWTAQARTKRRLHLEGPISRDPAMAVVRALEVFDEHSGDAEKAPIFTQDVITPAATVSSADTAEEALSVSMAAGRGADLTYIAQLLGVDEATAREQLRGQVYRDPDRPAQLQLAPKYLSGDVRQKLARARVAAAGDPQYEENVAALEAVIPEWFEAPRITINPSTTWIPAADRIEFARQTFDLPDVKADRESGKWRFETDRVSARAKEWGTPKWSALALLETLCNSEEIVVAHSAEEREKGAPQINMKATAHAQAQAGRIKSEFQRWMWADDERRDRLVKQFNNTLNCWADPQYDGRHLEIPGLKDVTPYFYQRNATMRGLNEPTVMLDHVVGAGKTLTMLMTAWELRRRGMIRQPWIVVPNHLVEEIAIDDVQRWFPAAKVLSAPPGMDNEARRRFIAQTATSDWDFVIVAESVFEKIGVKPARLTRYVQDQLAEITEALEDAKADDATRKTIKQIVRDKKQVERRLEKLLEAEKDSGLTLEDTGMDYLCIDEFHRYKNKQRSSPVAELALSPGSKRAENLKIVLQLLVERAGERALVRGLDPDIENMRIATVATGTRIANALAEEWVNQQYLRPDLLEAKGMSSVTEWGSVHTETKSVITTNSSGSKIRAREKVAAYANVRQMIAMTKVFTDIVTREQVPVKLPKLAGGKRLVITTVPGQEVRDFIADLDCRLDDLDPETTWYDNQLKVLNDGRDVALDPQLAGIEVENPEQTRAYVVAREMLIRYHATKNNRYRRPDGSLHPVPGALQIGFSDRGTPDGANRKASLYHAVKRWLVAGIPELDLAGMPEDKIRFMHDARKPSEKRQLISDSNNGHVAVLLGSTEKMGTGMNAQTRAIALHHIDVPWRPADLEQREGRIIRQKNQNDEIEILTYVTEGTVDVMMWSAVEQKSEFIQQARTGNIDIDKIADFAEDDLTHAAALTKAAATGDPRHLRLVELEPIVENLTALDEAHTATRSRASWQLKWLPGEVERRQAIIDSASQHLAAAAAWANEPGIISVGGQTFSDRGQANKALLAEARKALLQFNERYKRIHSDSELSREIGAIDGHTITATLVTLGKLHLTIGDLPVHAEIDRDRLFANAKHGNQPGQAAPPDDAAIARGLSQRIGNAYTGLSEKVQILRAKVEEDKADLEHATTVVDAPFERADELLAATVELAELRLALQQAKDSPEALAEQEAREQRLAAAGRLRGWSLALNPTKQTVERAGFVTKQQYVTAVREQMAQFAAAYAITGDSESISEPAPLAAPQPQAETHEPDASKPPPASTPADDPVEAGADEHNEPAPAHEPNAPEAETDAGESPTTEVLADTAAVQEKVDTAADDRTNAGQTTASEPKRAATATLDSTARRNMMRRNTTRTGTGPRI
jgi:N12 class adenine-specific DNA methylase